MTGHTILKLILKKSLNSPYFISTFGSTKPAFIQILNVCHGLARSTGVYVISFMATQNCAFIFFPFGSELLKKISKYVYSLLVN